ncbi:hypothetical protein [Ureibacillus manganicus]|uniref:Uncharacterized protein n=1 Tax=Ureibacillus manganicus DSM 26584 TaxID=1384049 RepID=A0A0A3IRG0_9BACL|nr:hypothetical protein [Ureibacillus manganicus]KGR77417.1 hypothetical protein CD29_15225 [Ureibacillus manganicus DSM 26584]
MSEIDKRKRLIEGIFDFLITKKGTVIIYYEGKQIKIIKDKEAERLIKRIEEAANDHTKIQLLLAKITGNFKRGNEKQGKNNN